MRLSIVLLMMKFIASTFKKVSLENIHIGLQILGSTQYPIQNHQKLVKLSLPLQSNSIQFRLSAKNNFQYKWSLYKRVDEMEEFIQSKKINLKAILQKQPQKSRLISQADQRSQILKRKDSKIQSESKIRSQSKIQFKNQPRGSVYNQNIAFQTAHFSVNYYLFKGNSYQQLSKAIQDKIKEIKFPLTETQGNIAQNSSGLKTKQSIRQSAKESKISKKQDKQNISRQGSQQIQNSKVPTDQKAVQLNEKNNQKQVNNQKQTEIEQLPQQMESIQPQNQKNEIQETPNESVPEYPTIQEGQNLRTTEQPQNLIAKLQKQQITETPLRRVEPFSSEINNASEQIIQENVQQKAETKQKNNSQKQITAIVQTPDNSFGKSSEKRKIFVVLVIILLIYLVSFFDLLGNKQDSNLSKNKKQKKSKFGNRKKTTIQ